MDSQQKKIGARRLLLDAALQVIRTKGYSATTVDDLCRVAGVTKGAFFHHFRSKDELAIAAAAHWSEVTGAFFEAAPYRKLADPLDRLLGYVAFRKAIVRGELPEFTCLVGTMAQETFHSCPSISDACGESISAHAALLEVDIAEAMRLYRPNADFTAESLALYTQAVIQGAFILAKAKQSAAIAADCIDHLHRYIETLFPRPRDKRGS